MVRELERIVNCLGVLVGIKKSLPYLFLDIYVYPLKKIRALWLAAQTPSV